MKLYNTQTLAVQTTNMHACVYYSGDDSTRSTIDMTDCNDPVVDRLETLRLALIGEYILSHTSLK